MRKLTNRKVAMLGVTAATMLILVMLFVSGIAAEEGGYLEIQQVPEKCTMLTWNSVPSDWMPESVSAKKVHLVETNRQVEGDRIYVVYKCLAYDVTNPGSAIEFRSEDFLDVVCRVPGSLIPLREWHQTISASGEAQLTCKGEIQPYP